VTSCATLLPAAVRPKVFVLPQDAWVQERKFILRCQTGTSDSLGNLAFSVQTHGTEGKDPPGDARLYVLDPASAAIEVNDVPGERGLWSAGVQGLRSGFLGVVSFLDFFGEYRLTWYEHTGVPTGARHDSGPGPGALVGVLPDGRVIVLNVLLAGPQAPSLEQYESDGGLRWATVLSVAGFLSLSEVDVDGRTLLGESFADGGVSLRWVDENGVPGPVFDGPPRLFDAFPRAEGGFFLLQFPPDFNEFPRWAGVVASGATTLEPVPDWLPKPGVTGEDWFRVTPARDGYLIRPSDAMEPILEVRSVVGELCGRVDLVPVDSIVGLGTSYLGADGTVLASGFSCPGSNSRSASLQANAGAQVCTCAWQYWPALLR
jgi:hypothetical protein